jgi:hypothetical protein
VKQWYNLVLQVKIMPLLLQVEHLLRKNQLHAVMILQ